ncbi:MAG: hypothetical protein IKV28_07215 [Bacteroidales bacterium]|nr:hypothetical protein [Bacteroidales bacterium]
MKKLILLCIIAMIAFEPSLHAQSHTRDFGKTMVYTGGGIAIVSAGVFGIGMMLNTNRTTDDATKGVNVIPGFGLAGIAAGGAIALLGTPFWIAGESYQNGFCIQHEEGFELRMDLSGSIAPPVGADIVAGYNLNESWFFGGGAGIRFANGTSIPIYADVRYSFSESRISPYIGMSIGGAYAPKNGELIPYYNLNLGSRIRHQSNDGGDWWIAAMMEMTHLLPYNFGIKVGYSF